MFYYTTFKYFFKFLPQINFNSNKQQAVHHNNKTAHKL